MEVFFFAHFFYRWPFEIVPKKKKKKIDSKKKSYFKLIKFVIGAGHDRERWC